MNTTAPTTTEAPAATFIAEKSLSQKQQARLIVRIIAKQARAKALYQNADALFQQLMLSMPVGAELDTPEGRYRIADNFAHTNTVWRSSRANRYELQPVKPEKPIKPAKVPQAICSKPAA